MARPKLSDKVQEKAEERSSETTETVKSTPKGEKKIPGNLEIKVVREGRYDNGERKYKPFVWKGSEVDWMQFMSRAIVREVNGKPFVTLDGYEVLEEIVPSKTKTFKEFKDGLKTA